MKQTGWDVLAARDFRRPSGGVRLRYPARTLKVSVGKISWRPPCTERRPIRWTHASLPADPAGRREPCRQHRGRALARSRPHGRPPPRRRCDPGRRATSCSAPLANRRTIDTGLESVRRRCRLRADLASRLPRGHAPSPCKRHRARRPLRPECCDWLQLAVAPIHPERNSPGEFRWQQRGRRSRSAQLASEAWITPSAGSHPQTSRGSARLSRAELPRLRPRMPIQDSVTPPPDSPCTEHRRRN